MRSFADLQKKYDLPDKVSGNRIALFVEGVFVKKDSHQIKKINNDFRDVCFAETGKYFDHDPTISCPDKLKKCVLYLFENKPVIKNKTIKT